MCARPLSDHLAQKYTCIHQNIWHRNIQVSITTLCSGICMYQSKHLAPEHTCIYLRFLHGNVHVYIRPPGTEICEMYPSEHLVSECTCIHQPPSTFTLLCHTYIPIPSVLMDIYHIFLCLYTSTAWHRHVHVYIQPPWHRSVHVWGGYD